MSVGGSTKMMCAGYFTVPNDYIYGYFRGKLFSSPFVRRYFYLSSSGNLYYYVSKSHCPDEPLCLRPIQTWLYTVSVVMGNSMTTTGVSGPEDHDVMEIHLSLDDKDEAMKLWVLSCDTLTILNEWVAALKKVKQARLAR